MSTLLNCLYVFVGGGLGALSRYWIQNMGFIDRNRWLYTVIINVTGCILIGVLAGLFYSRNIGRQWYLFAITGLLGGYTTFSAFSLDAFQLVQNGEPGKAITYVAITVVVGLIGCALGFYGMEKLLSCCSD